MKHSSTRLAKVACLFFLFTFSQTAIGQIEVVRRYCAVWDNDPYQKFYPKQTDSLETALRQLIQKRENLDSVAIGYYLLANNDILYSNTALADYHLSKGFEYVQKPGTRGALYQLDEQLATELLHDSYRSRESVRKSVEQYELGDEYGDAAFTKINLAYSFFKFNQCGKGIAQIETALKYFDSIKDRIPKENVGYYQNNFERYPVYLSGLCSTCLGDSLVLTGQSDASMKYFHTAIEYLEQLQTIQNPWRRGVIHFNLARAKLGLNIPDSLPAIVEHLKTARKAYGDHEQEIALTDCLIGYVSVLNGNIADTSLILRAINSLLEHKDSISSPFKAPDLQELTQPSNLNLYYLSRAYLYKAQLMEFLYTKQGKRLGYLEQALRDYETLLLIAQAERVFVNEDEALQSINYRFANIYRKAAAVAYQLSQVSNTEKQKKYYTAQTWKQVQRSKDFTLRQAVKSVRYPPEIMGTAKRDSTQKEQIRQKYRRIQVDRNKERKEKLISEWKKDKKDHDNWVRGLQTGTPDERRYYRERYTDYFVDAEEVPELIEADQTLVEYYFLEPKHLLVCTYSDTFGLEMRQIDLPKDFSENLRRFISEVATPSSRLQTVGEDSHQIYQSLIYPIKDRIKTERLLICPDQELAKIPFDALVEKLPSNMNMTDQYSYLGYNYAIAYDYSTSMYKNVASSGRSSNIIGDYRYNYELLAFAPFSMPTPVDLLIELDDNTRFLAGKDLPHSKRAISAIAKLLPPEKILVFESDSATLDHFLEFCPQARGLHLATHAFAQTNNIDSSFILFYPTKASPTHIKLYLCDIYAQKIPAEMIVLSTCESFKGNWVEGGGLFSLGRAFSFAGVKSVVTSRWVAKDAQTAVILENYYKNMQLNGKHMTKDKALQEAKSVYRGDHPYYWAHLTIIGNQEPFWP